MNHWGKSSRSYWMILGILAVGLVALPACGGSSTSTGQPGGGTTSSGTTGGDGGASEGGDPYANIDKATAGSVAGSVKFTGTVPGMAAISLGAEPYCDELHEGEDVREENHLQDANGGLKNVIVYLDHDFGDTEFPAPAAQLLDQRGCRYDPHVWGMMVGQSLTILNSDPLLHNINCKPTINKPFNEGMPMKNQKKHKSFSKPEVPVYFKCDVHPWMNAYTAVFAHPFFAVSGDDGSFKIEHVPAGTYKVMAWHEKWGFAAEGSATVEASGSATVEFSYDGSNDKSIHKTNVEEGK